MRSRWSRSQLCSVRSISKFPSIIKNGFNFDQTARGCPTGLMEQGGFRIGNCVNDERQVCKNSIDECAKERSMWAVQGSSLSQSCFA